MKRTRHLNFAILRRVLRVITAMLRAVFGSIAHEETRMRHVRLASVLVLVASAVALVASAQERKLVPAEFVVRPGLVRYWTFNAAANTRIAGRFRASGGAGNDIVVIIAEWNECENWINGHAPRSYYHSGKTTNGRMNVMVPGQAQYCIAFDNRMSTTSSKEIAADITRRDEGW